MEMKWLMLCREPRLYSCERIKQVCAKKGIELAILDPNRMLLSLNEGRFELYYQAGEHYDKARTAPILLPQYNGILPRFGTSSTEIGCTVLRHFEAQQIPILNNSAAFLLARNKWQSLQQLVANHLPVPQTNFAGNLVSVKAQLAHFSFPVIAKVLNGSQGNGVMLFENHHNAGSVLSTFQQLEEPYVCQHFISESKGQDIRVFVIGDNVIAAMQRQSEGGDFRANIHQGGQAKAVNLTEQERLLAIKATKAIGLDVAGVDLLRTAEGTVILEVNASPGFEGLESVANVDIATAIVDYFLSKMDGN